MVKLKEGELNHIFGALADPTRRKILIQLRNGESSVGVLAEPLEMSWPAVTKHIGVLEDAGLVQRRIEGRVHWLSIDDRNLQQAMQWVDEQLVFWEESLDRLKAYAEKKQKKETKGRD